MRDFEINIKDGLIALTYSAMLNVLMVIEMIPKWSYLNYSGEFSETGLVLSLLFALTIGILIPRKIEARSFLLSFLIYAFFIPAFVFAAYNIYRIGYLQIYIIILSFLIILITSSFKFKPVTIGAASTMPLFYTSIFLLTLLVGLQATFGGLSYFSLSLSDVYEFRRLSQEEIPSIFGYIFSSLSKTLIPIAIVLAISNRKYIFLIYIIFICFILFGMTHHKSVIFSPFVVIGIFFALDRVRGISIIGLLFLSFTVISLIEVYYMMDSDQIPFFTSLVIRRALLTPGMLDTLYLEFFADAPKLFWSGSRFGSWALENPYPTLPPQLIGEAYFGSTATSANTGIIGSGYAQAGLFGVALYSAIAGLLIALFNAYGRRVGHAQMTAITLTSIFVIVTTTDLTTALLTHGLLLLILLLAFL